MLVEQTAIRTLMDLDVSQEGCSLISYRGMDIPMS
jgi:hypothetical protein